MEQRTGRFFTVGDICDELRVSRKTVISWISAGQLKAFKPGGGRLWRIRRADFQKFIKGGPATLTKFTK